MDTTFHEHRPYPEYWQRIGPDKIIGEDFVTSIQAAITDYQLVFSKCPSELVAHPDYLTERCNGWMPQTICGLKVTLSFAMTPKDGYIVRS